MQEGGSTGFWREVIGIGHFVQMGGRWGSKREFIETAVFTEGASECGSGLDEGESDSDKGLGVESVGGRNTVWSASVTGGAV